MSELAERVKRLESKISELESNETAMKNETNRLRRQVADMESTINLQMQNLMKRIERSVRR